MEIKRKILIIVISIIMVLFIWHNFLVTGNNVIFIFIFLASYNILKALMSVDNKRAKNTARVIAIIYSIIQIICKSINTDFTMNNILNKWVIINFVGYYIIAWSLITWLYNSFDTKKFIVCKKIENAKIMNKPVLLFFIVFALIFLAWLPYFLRYYPGIVTSDSYSQIEQTIGILPLQNHHPITHTAIIGIFVNLGLALTNDINFGIALYSIASMVIMAVFNTSVLMYLRKKQVPQFLQILLLLYYMFYPVNAMYSITMWKDILFSGIIPIFIISNIELIFNTQDFLSKKKNVIMYILIAIFTILLKHNGLYVVILTLPFIFVVLRTYWKKVLPMFLSIIVIYELTNLLFYNVLNITKGSAVEALSIPVQQIARIEKKHRNELDEETKNSINQFFKVENIGDLYDPILSDPVKWNLKEGYFKENKVEFLKLWLKLVFKYPKDSVESLLSNSYGYYYPEAFRSVVSRVTMDHNLGIQQQPKIKGQLVEQIDSIIDKRDVPIVSMMFSIGFAFWLIITCLGYKIYKKQYKYILIYIPVIVLWLTCIASPVNCEFRYAYPLFTTLPIFVSLNYTQNKEKME